LLLLLLLLFTIVDELEDRSRNVACCCGGEALPFPLVVEASSRRGGDGSAMVAYAHRGSGSLTLG
jgi:hypothetical protein